MHVTAPETSPCQPEQADSEGKKKNHHGRWRQAACSHAQSWQRQLHGCRVHVAPTNHSAPRLCMLVAVLAFPALPSPRNVVTGLRWTWACSCLFPACAKISSTTY